MLEQHLKEAKLLDESDPLANFRNEFIFPKTNNQDCIYLCGNSLGLQPKKAKENVEAELNNWAEFGVEGHFKSSIPWFSYHEAVREDMADIVGAKPNEVVAMNSLSTNLHLLMVSFYQPTKQKYKIIIEANAFPSDRYAVMSQLDFHGFDPHVSLIEIVPKQNQQVLKTSDIIEAIESNSNETALILLSGVQYLTGQCFDLKAITKAAHKNNILIGFDLAHSAGNVILSLHDWDVDFAAWCSYKYLNAGPGGIAGCYVHEKHCQDESLPKFAGWWGNDPKTRFQMSHNFTPVASADSWQLSNPPIFQLAALRGSLGVFSTTSMTELRKKGELQTSFMISLLREYFTNSVSIITPLNINERGNQLSLRLNKPPQDIQKQLAALGIITDFRSPDVLRLAVAPLYTSFMDCYQFLKALDELIN